MSTSSIRRSLTALVLGALLLLLSGSAQTQRDTSSADARLRALYTEEWNWRQEEMARGKDQSGGAGASDDFHDAILAVGSVPLPVLEQHMAQFIADGGVNQRPTPRQ